MNKRIFDEVENNIQSVDDNKDENYKKIKEIYFDDKKEKPSFIKRILFPLVGVFVVLISALLFLLLYEKPEKEKKYFLDNEVSVVSSLEEFVADEKSFILNFENLSVDEVKRVYDSISNDTLKYYLSIKNNTATIEIVYITNKYSEFTDIEILDKVMLFQGIKVEYNFNFRSNKISIVSYLEKGGQKLYISYEDNATSDSEEPFWNFMNDFVTVK